MIRLSCVMLALTCVCVVASAQADAIPVENIEVSSTYGGGNGHSSKWNLINDNLPADASSVAEGIVWDTPGITDTDADRSPWVAFYFGNAYTLNEMMIWNYQRGYSSGRGVCDTIVLVSTDTGDDWLNYTFTALPGVYRFDQAPDAPVMQTIDLGGVPATAVKFQILSNWAGIVFGPEVPSEGQYSNSTIAGLSKVAFDGTPVPEPATMTLLALGGLALLRRGRR